MNSNYIKTIERKNKAYNNKNENAVPIDPLASRKLDAIGDHLIEVFTILGLRLIPNIDGGEVDPTPTAAPVELIIGALAAYLIINPQYKE